MFKWLAQQFQAVQEETQQQALKNRSKQLEDLRTFAYHWGYVHCYTEHWSYPSLYAGEKGQQKMEAEAARLWTSNRNFPIGELSVQAFIEEFCNGWRDALVKVRS